MKNDYKNYELGMTEKQAIKDLSKDADFQNFLHMINNILENYILK